MADDPFAGIAQPAPSADPFAQIAKPIQQQEEPPKPSFVHRLTADYDPGAQNLSAPLRFFSSVGGAVLGFPKNIYQAVTAPLTPEETQEFKGHTRIPGEVAFERLMGAPLVRGAEQYIDPKTRPTLRQAASVLPEALGQGVGTTVAAELGTRGLSSGLSTVGKLRRGVLMQPTLRKVTGVEPAVKEAVTAAADKQTQAIADTAAQREAGVKRAGQAKTVDEHSVKLGEQLGKVEESVATEANAKFKAVREKIGNPETAPTGLVESVRNAETEILQGIPENIKEFRNILSMEAPEAQVGAEMIKEHYDPTFEAEGGEPLTWDKLQSLKSRLDARLRGGRRGRMNGDVKRAVYQVRDHIVDTMGQMAEQHGAQAEWADAKNFWRQYKEDFHEPTGPSGSGSPVAQALDAADPKNIRQPFIRTQSGVGNRGIETLKKYPQHGGTEAAATAEQMLQAHGELGYMPRRNPNAPEPAAPIVNVQKVAQTALAQRAKNWGSFNARDIGILASSVLAQPIIKMLGGNLPEGPMSLLPYAAMTYEGGKFAASRYLNRPAVIEWLSRTPPEEVAVLSKIPGADKVKIMDGLTQIAVQSGQPVRLSPQARLLLGPANVAKIMAATGAVSGSQIQNRRDALNALGK